MSKILIVNSPKGGVGKTTTAINLAASLAVADYKTLLIDLDPSGNCAHYFDYKCEVSKGDIFDVLAFSKSFSSVIMETSIKNLYFIPSYDKNAQKEEKIALLCKNYYLLKNILEGEKYNYHFVILDTPPYLKETSNLSLIAGDSLIVPVRSGVFSLHALSKILDHLLYIKKNFNSNLTLEGILLNMYEEKSKAWFLTNNEIFSKYSEFIFKTYIPNSPILAEASFYKMPIILYNARSVAAKAFLKLAEEIIEKNKVVNFHKTDVKPLFAIN